MQCVFLTGHPAPPGGLFCAVGNPLNDGTWTYTWQNGRQLARMQKESVDASFVYNENGLRVQKTVNGVVTNYTLHGKNVVHIYMVEREIQSADILSCGFATFVPKTFGAGFFTPRPDAIVPQSRQTTCSLSSRLT